MTDMHFPPPPNERVLRALRAAYRSPDDEQYWDALEARILARVAADGGSWGGVFEPWVRMGFAAAAAAVLIFGLALARTEATEAQRAFEEVVAPVRPLPAHVATQPEGGAGREATLRYLITH